MDDARLAALCEHEWPRLVGFLGLYSGDQDVAEDAAQEALTRLCRDWHRVSRMAAPTAWLYRVAVNVTKSHFRRVAVARSPRAQLEVPGGGPDVADVLAVRAAVLALPDRQRATLLLRYFADLPVREVATVLGCSEGTVKAQTSAAIANLRKADLVDTAEPLEGADDEQ